MSHAEQHESTLTLSDGTLLAYTLHTVRLKPDTTTALRPDTTIAPEPDTTPAPTAGRPRLVLIHSLALDRGVWDGVVRRLRTEADILAYDCRGHGLSGRRRERFTVDLFAKDLAELLDHIGWPNATIAGCSMGGCVALAFARLHQARADALGLIDTTAWYGPDAGVKFRERADAARAKGMAALFDFQATRWFSDEFRASHPDALTRTLAVFVATDVDCYAAACALLGDVDERAHLPAFPVPVAIVVGEEDYATPVDMARLLHGTIPQSTLTVLPRARHLTPIEHPDAIASELRALMGRAREHRA